MLSKLTLPAFEKLENAWLTKLVPEPRVVEYVATWFRLSVKVATKPRFKSLNLIFAWKKVLPVLDPKRVRNCSARVVPFASYVTVPKPTSPAPRLRLSSLKLVLASKLSEWLPDNTSRNKLRV